MYSAIVALAYSVSNVYHFWFLYWSWCHFGDINHSHRYHNYFKFYFIEVLVESNAVIVGAFPPVSLLSKHPGTNYDRPPDESSSSPADEEVTIQWWADDTKSNTSHITNNIAGNILRTSPSLAEKNEQYWGTPGKSRVPGSCSARTATYGVCVQWTTTYKRYRWHLMYRNCTYTLCK